MVLFLPNQRAKEDNILYFSTLFYIIDRQSSTTTAIVLFGLLCEMGMMMLLGFPPSQSSPDTGGEMALG